MKGWKIKIGLWECKNMYGLTEEEEMLPFLPRVGDVLWISDACEERLKKRLLKCRKGHGCGGCPFANEKGETDIKDEVIVHEVFFKVEDHEVELTLRKDGIVWKQYEI
ncbi:MAG: hypothetical protein K6F74_05420 [Prevotella sp.]|nr:hypothetical protein [Prevotella sp.]